MKLTLLSLLLWGVFSIPGQAIERLPKFEIQDLQGQTHTHESVLQQGPAWLFVWATW